MENVCLVTIVLYVTIIYITYELKPIITFVKNANMRELLLRKLSFLC